MKNIFSFLLLLLILTNSCSKDFGDTNIKKTKLSEIDNASLENLFSAALYRGSTGGFQTYQALYPDLQAQYFATTNPNFLSDRNVIVGGWQDGPWNNFFGITYPQIWDVINYTKVGGKLENPIKNAMANIWKVYIYMPLTDQWGPVPYSDAGNGKSTVLYDSQDSIYYDFITTLKNASAQLAANTTSPPIFSAGDLIYGGNVSKWLKFANSLRLRVALRISKVAPTLAQSEAEAAAKAPGGLITENADNAFMKITNFNVNPLARISDWNEFRMSAAMESVLKGYNDPRLPKFFNPAVTPLSTAQQYKGIRNGLTQVQMGDAANNYNANSNLSTYLGINSQNTTPWVVMYASEIWFLLAEAKKNGWNVGAETPQYYYEKGITASLNQWGVTDAAVISSYINGTSLPAALNDIYNTPAMTNIPVKFSTDLELQKEQIGTQKWIALFPYSPEAWSEFRRTGYPKLYPRLNSDNPDAPAIDPSSLKRRTYPPIETSVNPAGLASGISKLNGPDKTSTRLWWNK